MKVFLSYSSKDRNIAEQINLALLGAGHDVFFDKISLPAGADFNSQIRKAIADSDIFIFLISPYSVKKGTYVLTELKFAKEKWNRPWGAILPVVIEATNDNLIDNYLKAVTILTPTGNIAAEVAKALERLPNQEAKSNSNQKGNTPFLYEKDNPAPSNGTPRPSKNLSTSARKLLIFFAAGLAFFAALLTNFDTIFTKVKKLMKGDEDKTTLSVTVIPDSIPSLQQQLRNEYKTSGYSKVIPAKQDWTFQYAIIDSTSILKIVPKSKILDAYIHDHIAPINDEDAVYKATWPTVDVLVTNNSSKTLIVKRIVLKVEKSDPDNRVLFAMLPIKAGSNSLLIYNEGWSTARNCNVHINIGPIAGRTNDSTITITRKFNHIKRGVAINLDEEINKLINRKFEKLFYWGEITYFDSNSENLKQRETVSFGPHIIKGRYIGGGPGLDAPDLQVDLLLSSDSSSYEIETRFAKTIKNGEATRINFAIGANKSSFHTFRVITYFDDGSKQESIPVHVNIFLPFTGLLAFIEKSEREEMSVLGGARNGGLDFSMLIDNPDERK